MLLKVYEGTFVKQNGDHRKMRFLKLSEVPSDFLPPSKGGGPRNLSEGTELVWDLDSNGFRAFNWSTVVGSVVVNVEEINQR